MLSMVHGNVVLVLVVLLGVVHCAAAEYLVGLGKADITGPAADVDLMGYANPLQTAQGIHMRLYSRAYVIGSTDNPKKRFVFVNIDACMASQLVTIKVLEKLKAEFGDLYTADNVAISGTHTHASPAGFLQYVLYDITSLGFVAQTFDCMVEGIVQSIRAAHADVAPSRLFHASGELLEANINRSPTAYLANPPEERARFKHNIDKDMTVLKVVAAADERPRGLVSWFPVHCTSMNNTNRLVSGDNKGVAEQLTEKWAARRKGVGGAAAATATGGAPAASAAGGAAAAGTDFVAAFAQANVGDTSPNVLGAFCLDTGAPCDAASSTCGGRNEMCHGRGPAFPDDARSTYIIGERQHRKAVELFEAAKTEVQGPVEYRHKFLDMTNITVSASNFTRAGRTCKAAAGFSFAAGTTDGPGAFDFKQGDTAGTAFWRLVRNFIHAPSAEQEACQAPKPILLDTGNLNLPYEWQPAITEISILRAGSFVILAVPGEFTTMAGRRLRAAVRETVRGAWGDDVHVVIAGLTNTYSSYITTYEEYGVQRYEGAFTIYGPHTLDAYIQEMVALAKAMIADQPVTSAVTAPDLLSRQISLLAPVVRDSVPYGGHFGEVVDDVEGVYRANDTVKATFRAGCPRNNLRINDTFLAVEKLHPQTLQWQRVYADDDWSTKFHWLRHWKLSFYSFATIEWTVPADAEVGVYRLKHYGDWRTLGGVVSSYEGTSSQFVIVATQKEYAQLSAAATHNSSRVHLDWRGPDAGGGRGGEHGWHGHRNGTGFAGDWHGRRNGTGIGGDWHRNGTERQRNATVLHGDRHGHDSGGHAVGHAVNHAAAQGGGHVHGKGEGAVAPDGHSTQQHTYSRRSAKKRHIAPQM